MSLLQLRRDLDEIIGPTRRANFFHAIFNLTSSRYPVMHTHNLTEAEYIAQSLRYLKFPTTVEQTAAYPNYHTVWVKL